MVRIFWSLKGGQGTSVTAAIIALRHQFHHDSVLIIDFGGDIAPILGQRVESQVGLIDWFLSQSGPEALDQLVTPLLPQLSLLYSGTGVPAREATPFEDRWATLEAWLNHDGRVTIVDLGTLPGQPGQLGSLWVQLTTWLLQQYHTTLVTRPEYLSLRRYFEHDTIVDSLAILQTSTELLSAEDVADLCDRPVHFHIAIDETISHAVESGTLATLPAARLFEFVECAL